MPSEMTFRSSRSAHSLHLAMVAFVTCCIGLKANVYAQDKGTISLNLNISVVDRDTGAPIPKAQISIPHRAGDSQEQALREIKGTTDQNGRFATPAAEFLLNGTAHKLIVRAEGFEELNLDLPDAVLRETYNTKEPLSVGVALVRATSNSARDLPVAANGKTPEPVVKRGVDSESHLLKNAWSILNTLVWWLGLISILLAAVGGAAWYRGYWERPRLAPASYVRYDEDRLSHYVRKIDDRLVRLDMDLQRGRAQTEKLTEALKVIHGLVSSAHPSSMGAVSVSRGFDEPAKYRSDVASISQSVTGPERGVPARKPERARAFYRRLLDHQPVECKPIYLETDAKSSILEKLADDNVYLVQVASSMAPFILFSDGEPFGWVFPNPSLAFDRSTLKDIFPELNEAQFNDAREQIEPVVVNKIDEGRWKVDRENWSVNYLE